MPDTRGHLLPVYILADESASMTPYISELNDGLISLYEALRSDPMVAAKVRVSVIGFSDSAEIRLSLADMRTEAPLPQLQSRSTTNYGAAFRDLLSRIPKDVATLKSSGYQIHRPAVFFLSDGEPSNGHWRDSLSQLTNRSITSAAPNIIACGIGEARSETLAQIATQPDFAFVSVPGADIGVSIARFFIALTSSVVQSGRSLTSASPELVIERPEGFRMAIDVI